LQHLSLAIDLVKAFNSATKSDILVEPAPILGKACQAIAIALVCFLFSNQFLIPFLLFTKSQKAPVKKIMSLKDGKLKMSKSDPAEHSRISLDDDEKTIRLRLKRSKTDNMGDVTLDAVNRPEVANLLAIYGECAGVSLEQAAERFRGVSLGDFKKELEDAVVKTIEPISREMMRLLACPEHLVAILESGEEAAREEASKVLSMVQRSLGLR
jgi:tryptophanyl-tRNA synthetase